MDYKNIVAMHISMATGTETEKIEKLIEIPPKAEMGDYAFPCFSLAKELKKAPPVIAKDIKDSIVSHEFEDIKVMGPYLNFFLKKGLFIKDSVLKILEEGENFGKSYSGKKRKVLLDYSSPNICKPFSVALLFTTALGNSLYRLFSFEDYDAVGINHLGDYGTQFGKLIYAFDRWGDEKALEEDSIKELLRVYVKFHQEAEIDETLNDRGRETFKRLEEGNAHEVELWEKFRALSIKDFDRVYKRLNISFDSIMGEAFYSDRSSETIDELKEKNLLTNSQGTQAVMLDEYNMPPAIILKSDGSTIYVTRDLTAAKYRHETYDFYKNIYVVGSTQSLHFKQLFKVLELMGYDWAKDCVHVGFGLVKFQGMHFATREGRVFYLEELLDKAKETVLNIINEKNPELENKEEVAEKVGIGGILFMYLKNSREKDINFDLKEVLNFEGETGPYVQYTYARAMSILRKFSYDGKKGREYLDLLQENEEFELAKTLMNFNGAVLDAIDKYEPSQVTRFTLEVAKSFNKFYNNINIGLSEEKLREGRLHLVAAAAQVIKNALNLLGIEAVERM